MMWPAFVIQRQCQFKKRRRRARGNSRLGQALRAMLAQDRSGRLGDPDMRYLWRSRHVKTSTAQPYLDKATHKQPVLKFPGNTYSKRWQGGSEGVASAETGLHHGRPQEQTPQLPAMQRNQRSTQMCTRCSILPS